MAGGGDIAVRYNQNHNASDATYNTVIYTTAPSYTSLNFTAPVGMEFSEWNTEQDGSGISYAVGDTVALGQYNTAELYAIWEAMTYYVTGTELTAVANAIRTKGDTSEALTWPDGFVSAIDTMSGGAEMATVTLIAVGTMSFMPSHIYYTDSNMTVNHVTTGEVRNTLMPVGSIIFCYGNSGPAMLEDENVGITVLYEEASPKALYAAYEVTG